MPASSSGGEPGARPTLRRDELALDPLEQFAAWFGGVQAAGVPAPEAAALATATSDGRPSIRMVLVKVFDEQGFRFHTNFESRKARELAANPHAALLFHWQAVGRQVRVEGEVAKVSEEESRRYFETRSREARLSAAASPQSTVLASREELERRVEELRARYEGEEVPLPSFWGGFVVSPSLYEFWQHRENRLHDRFRYRLRGDGWLLERLAP